MARYIRFYLINTGWTDKPEEISGVSSINTDISPTSFKYENEVMNSGKTAYYSTVWLSTSTDEVASISISYSTNVKSHKLTKYSTSLMNGEEYDYSSYGITQTIEGNTVTYSGTFKQWYSFGYVLNSSSSAIAGVNCSVELGEATVKYTVNVATQNCTCATEIKNEYEHGEIISLEFSTGTDEYGFKSPETDCYFNSDGLTNATYSVSDDMQTVTLTGEVVGNLSVSVVPHKIHRVRITGTIEGCTCNYSDGEEITNEKQYIRIKANTSNYIEPTTLENCPKVVYSPPYNEYVETLNSVDCPNFNLENYIENYGYSLWFNTFSTFEENGVTFFDEELGKFDSSYYSSKLVLSDYIYEVDGETRTFKTIGEAVYPSFATEIESEQIIVVSYDPDIVANTSDYILNDEYKTVIPIYYSRKYFPDPTSSEVANIHRRIIISSGNYTNYKCNYSNYEYVTDSKPFVILVANDGYKFYRDKWGIDVAHYTSGTSDVYPLFYSQDETVLVIPSKYIPLQDDTHIFNIRTVLIDDSEDSGGTGGDSGGTGGDDSGGTGGDDSGGTGGDSGGTGGDSGGTGGDSGGTGGDDSGGTGGDDSGGTETNGKLFITGTLENCTCNYSDGETLSTGKPVIIIVANNNCSFKSTYYYKAGSTVKAFNVSSDKTYLYTTIEDFSSDYRLDDVYWVVENPIEQLGQFANLYNPTESELSSLSKIRFINDVDMGQYITALFTIPFKIPTNLITGIKRNIVLGTLNSTVTANGLTTYKMEVDLGEITIPEKYGNIYDYIDTECILNLPYFDKIYLSNEFVIGHTINIKYIIDLYSGNATANIYSSFTGGIIESVNGSIACNIPFIQKDTNSIIGLINNSNKYNIDTANITITRNKPYNVDTIFGYETVDFGIIGNYKGFIKVSDVVLNSSATNEEKNEIIDLLKEGVTIYEN